MVCAWWHCYFSFWSILYPFTLLTAQTMKISKKMKKKKKPGDIIILHYCAKPQDHRLHCSCDMVHDRYNCYFSFWAIFCPFAPPPPLLPLRPKKWKYHKIWKKHLEISSFYRSIPKIMITGSTVPEIWCVPDVIIFHFELFFALLPY